MRIVKSGAGWRIGFDPEAIEFKGLVGAENWAIELTQTELQDFCRLSIQLSTTISQMERELMEEEAIACEAESNFIWMEVEGYPHAYNLRLILNTGRRVEVSWAADAVPDLIRAAQMLFVF